MADPAWLQIGVALIALGATLISAVAVADPGTKANPRGDTATMMLWLGFGLTAIGVAAISINAATAFGRWRDDGNTPFEMVFDPNDPECVWQELQTNGQWSTQLRVKVTNIGSAGVERVRVHMLGPPGHHTFFLHIRHDNEPLHMRSREGEYLTVGQFEYFDVACWNTQRYFLTYADGGIMGAPVANGVHTVVLTAMGWRGPRDVVSLPKTFTLTIGPAPQIALAEV